VSQCALLSLFLTELEVARLSTEGNLEDLKFPENMGHGSTIQLSANTLKQNGRNGKLEHYFLCLSIELVSVHCFLVWNFRSTI
jgi:hypothetical protein